MILFRFSLSRTVAPWTRPASSTAADTSRSVLIVMLQTCLVVNLWKLSNWSFNCQPAACSEVLAEWTRFIHALPTPLPRFSPHYPEKKKKNAVSVQHFRDKIDLIKLWLMRKFNKTELGFCESHLQIPLGFPRKKKNSRRKERHVLHKKLYFQNSVSSQCRTRKYTCELQY